MTTTTPFHCRVCKAPIGNPHLCFDRRIEKLGAMTHEGKPVSRVDIAYRETLFFYCCHEHWQMHEPDIALALALKKTFPSFGFVTPCCRCGKLVNRTQPYVCYSISEMELEGSDVLIAQCLDDNDYAVLCPECEMPDAPEAEEAVTDMTEKERAPA